MRRRFKIALSVALWAVGMPADAMAEEPTDTVLLRSGGLYRGKVSEIVPDDHVTIAVERGETKRIPWAEVDRLMLGSADAPSAPSASAPTVIEPAAAPEMVGPRVHVRLATPKQVSLYRKPANTTMWVHACFSPCNIDLPTGDRYRVQASSIKPSDEFRLDAKRENTVVTVDPSSFGGSVLGGVIATAGAVTGLVGLLLLGKADTRVGGLVAFGAGTSIAVGGFLIYKSSTRTEITQSNDEPTRKVGRESPTLPAGMLDAFLFPVLHHAF